MGSVALSTGTLMIRADASARIGAGHMMRCFALAQAWQLKGGLVVFLSHCESDALRQHITDAGMEYIPIANPHPDPRDLQVTLGILRTRSAGTKKNLKSPTENPTWLILDGYHFEPAYQQAVRAAGCRLLVIDDIADLPVYHADILLNQNLGAEKLKYNCDSDTAMLLGSRYALLRQEFLAWRGWQRKIPITARRVLVTMGGGDPDNVTLKIIHALEQVRVDGLEAVVVVGGNNPHYNTLLSEIRNLQLKIRLERNASNMPELMAWADVAVSAGGSTCWELAFMGVPTCTVILANNQALVAKSLYKRGVSVNIGWFNSVRQAELSQILDNLLKDRQQRSELSRRGRLIVDGNGSMAVAATLLERCSTSQEEQ